MKDVLKTTFILAVSASFLLSCNFIVPSSKGHFSQKVEDIEEPQTDDERTLLGEFHDFILLTDSLATIWDGTDTLSMRRLWYEITQQESRLDKVRKFPNIRRSVDNKTKEQVDAIMDEIREKFPKDLREEWYDFYFNIYYCSNIWKMDRNRPYRGEKVYQNTLGEYYVMRKGYDGRERKVPVYFDDGIYLGDNSFAPY